MSQNEQGKEAERREGREAGTVGLFDPAKARVVECGRGGGRRAAGL